MATVKIEQFHGIAPRIHPSLLADGMAVTAHNCRLKTGKLVPLRQPEKAEGAELMMEKSWIGGETVQLANIADARSILPWKRTDGGVDFLLFPGVVWMADGNLADDERTRIVVSGDTGADFGETHNAPQIYMRNPVTGRKFAHPLCKNALPAPKVSRVGGGEIGDEKRYTYFFATWVDEFGYESPCSPPSVSFKEKLLVSDGWTIVVGEDGTVTATKQGETPRSADRSHSVVETGAGGAVVSATFYADADIEYEDGDAIQIAQYDAADIPAEAVKVRVYKVVTGTEEGRIQFVAEVPAAVLKTSLFNVTVKDEDAGEVITMIESPYADMRCILDVPGAYYCGFSATHPKTVCFSEVDLLYSWPSAYQYDVKDNIVALAVTSNTVFALTDGWPYVLSGTSPDAMTVTKLAGPASCVSARGVCVYRNAVYFAGQSGLMTIYNSADAGTVCANLTERVFTKEQWQAFNPASCVMGQFDGAILLFFTLRDGTHRALTVDLTEQTDSVTTNDEVAKCVCVDNKTDRMYYVREGV